MFGGDPWSLTFSYLYSLPLPISFPATEPLSHNANLIILLLGWWTFSVVPLPSQVSYGSVAPPLSPTNRPTPIVTLMSTSVCLSVCEHISGVTRAIFTDFWATVCKTVRPMLSVLCLAVTFVHCGQTVGRIKMKLGMQVGLVPGHIALDWDPAPPPQGAQPPSNFRPISVAAKFTLAETVEKISTVSSTPLFSCDSGTIYCWWNLSSIVEEFTQQWLWTLPQHFMLIIMPHFCCQNLYTFCRC